MGQLAGALHSLILRLRQVTDSGRLRLSRAAPAIVALAGVAATGALWSWVHRLERDHLTSLAEVRARAVVADIERLMPSYVKNLARLGARGAALREKRRWQFDLTGMKATMWVEPSGKVGWVTPPEGNEEFLDEDFSTDATVQAALSEAGQTGQPAQLRSTPLPDGDTRLLLFVPVSEAGKLEGFLVGAFSARSLFGLLVRPDIAADWALGIFDRGREVYRSGLPAGDRWLAQATLNLLGAEQTLRAAPRLETLSRTRSPLPRAVLAIGGAFTLLLSLSVGLAQSARRRARQSETAQAALAASIAHNEDLVRQRGIHAATLSVVRGLASVLAQPGDLTSLLGGVLVRCLDATGVSTGLLYTTTADGGLRLKAQAGVSPAAEQAAAACFGDPAALRQVLDRGEPVACAAETLPQLRPIADQLGKKFLLLIPFAVADERIGLLLLAADSENLCDPAWTVFARSLAGQLGHTVALGRSVAQGAVSEARYRSLMENANDAILLMEPGLRILEANRQAAALIGRPREEIVGLAYDDLILPDPQEQAVVRRNTLFAKGLLRAEDRLLLRRDGTKVPVDMSASVTRVGDETLVLLILRDISERKQVEQALRASEQRYRSLMENANDAILLLEPGRRILEANRQAELLLGRPREQIVGRTYADFVAPHERADSAERNTLLLQKGHDRVQNRRLIRGDGSPVLVDVSASLVRIGDQDLALAILRDVTERNQAEQAVRRSEARMKSVLDAALDAVIGMDADGRVSAWNPRAAVIFGWSAGEAVGRQLSDMIIPARYRQAHRDGLARFLVTGEGPVLGRRVELSAIRRDGSEFPVELSITVVREGTTVLFNAFVADITERKSAQAALQQAQERLQHVVTSSPAVLYSLRPAGRQFNWVSPNVERLLGFTPEQARTPDFWPSHLHPDERERVLADVEAILHENSLVQEYRFRTSAGGYRWLRAELRLLRDADGNATEAVGSWSDITDRKDAELLQQESEEQYRLLFESNPHPMWVYDEATLRFLAVNQAAVRSYGYTAEEFLGMTIRDIRPPAEVPLLEERLAQITEIRGPDTRMRTWTHNKKDGRKMQVEVVSTRITFAGRPARLTLVTDVTETRALEAQLNQAQRMESVGRLAGGVAHDFNNLLGVITGYGELLRRRLQEPRLKKYSEDILQAAERAAGLTRQLLAFSRRQVLQPRTLDLNRIVEELEKMLRRLIGEDIVLKTTLARELGPIRADRGQIEQVLMNLVVNARDAMPKGGRLTLETASVVLDDEYARKHEGVSPGPYAMLAVSDTGHGMSPETRSRVFEPFFTTKGEGQGTGLGLATVYGIVKQSGGHVSVYSELGKGSSFKVYLPRLEGVREEERSPVESAGLLRGDETILLVEDESSLRELVCECLQDCGYKVLDARHGEDALERAAAHPAAIQLLMTDVVMPGMGGRDLAERLSQRHPGLKVLYMSGYTDDAVVHHGVLSEKMDFLQKPFTQDALAKKVREVLDRPDGAGA